MENQKRILDLSEKFGKENIVAILGTSEAESAGLTAETVTAGDPTLQFWQESRWDSGIPYI